MTGTEDVLHVLLTGAAAYAAVVVILRISGKRTLAKMNAFDFVVTVALGSILATTILSADTVWIEGTAAVAVLVVLQALVSWCSVRFRAVKEAVRAQPTLLVRDGEFLPESLRSQRIAEDEVLKAIRSTGLGDLALVGAVIIESDGTFSVIPASEMGDRSTLKGVSQ